MDGLQRSAVSFRRQGSSGSVWDDKFLSGELKKLADQSKEEKKNSSQAEQQNKDDGAVKKSSRPPELKIERSRSNGGRGYRAGKVTPAVEPPSPKVSACCFCRAVGKGSNTRRRQPPPPKSAKRVK